MNPLPPHINDAVNVIATSFGTATDSSPAAIGLHSIQSLLRSCSLLGEQHLASCSNCLSSAGIDDLNHQLHYDCICSSPHPRSCYYCDYCC
jgi:hypothetical protein